MDNAHCTRTRERDVYKTERGLSTCYPEKTGEEKKRGLWGNGEEEGDDHDAGESGCAGAGARDPSCGERHLSAKKDTLCNFI